MASRLFERGVLGVASVVSLSGCTQPSCEALPQLPQPVVGAGDDPVVVEGQWIKADTLSLTFSDPLTPVEALAPERFAISSFNTIDGQHPDAPECLAVTRYGDLTGFIEIHEAWVDPADPRRLNLRVGVGPICREDQIPGTQTRAGLLLVYADYSGPGRLRAATNDEPIPDLGPEWMSIEWERCVGYQGYAPSYCSLRLRTTAMQGILPSLDHLAPIPCPS